MCLTPRISTALGLAALSRASTCWRSTTGAFSLPAAGCARTLTLGWRDDDDADEVAVDVTSMRIRSGRFLLRRTSAFARLVGARGLTGDDPPLSTRAETSELLLVRESSGVVVPVPARVVAVGDGAGLEEDGGVGRW